jgi:hypothetical protein
MESLHLFASTERLKPPYPIRVGKKHAGPGSAPRHRARHAHETRRRHGGHIDRHRLTRHGCAGADDGNRNTPGHPGQWVARHLNERRSDDGVLQRGAEIRADNCKQAPADDCEERGASNVEDGAVIRIGREKCGKMRQYFF